jgi:hypothetical protein
MSHVSGRLGVENLDAVMMPVFIYIASHANITT